MGHVRVLIVTSGSMGDVAPYTGLGNRLREAGHEVTVATHEPFRAAITATDLQFHPIPGDMREILPNARGQDGVSSGTGPRALTRLLKIAGPLVSSLGAGMAGAVSAVRPDAVLLSTVVAPLGYQIADAFDVPWAGVFLQPVHPTRDFGSVLVGGRNFGPWGNLALGRLVDLSARPLYAGPIRALRRDLGLPPASMRALQAWQQSRYPTFHGFSPSVVSRPADWPAPLRVTGYWWPARPHAWSPPPALTTFLAAGPRPVFIGFGSMAPGHGARLGRPIMTAIRQAGVRAVVQAGWSGLDVGASDDVITVGELPHDWLFGEVAAVVHHAGAGTTAAGLRAGVPAVGVPVLADQPFWARRLTDLGTAPGPLPLSSLTADRLAAALRAVTTNPHYAARAAAMAARLAAEDGAQPIIDWLAELP
ncbi:glycosyltransferase [Actinoplanes sp. NPDC051343]|uniref:glycosyltransferase n=1 Tax=Actinoplanes sp. NPDC051343 TaxID=3363906 RepID=UPI0037A5AA4C